MRLLILLVENALSQKKGNIFTCFLALQKNSWGI
jgi:hypothetical protein